MKKIKLPFGDITLNVTSYGNYVFLCDYLTAMGVSAKQINSLQSVLEKSFEGIAPTLSNFVLDTTSEPDSTIGSRILHILYSGAVSKKESVFEANLPSRYATPQIILGDLHFHYMENGKVKKVFEENCKEEFVGLTRLKIGKCIESYPLHSCKSFYSYIHEFKNTLKKK